MSPAPPPRISNPWLGDRWLDAVIRLSPGGRRHLALGRRYARTGRVVDARVADGVVSGAILGHRKTLYRVTITVRPIAEDVWDRVLQTVEMTESLVRQFRGGVVPPSVAVLAESAGDTLWPWDGYALRVQCECKARGDSCRHVVALHCWLAERLDRDPFVLFALRGCPDHLVQRALHGASRTSISEPWNGGQGAPSPGSSVIPATPTVPPPTHQLLGPEASSEAFDAWRAPVPDLVPDASDAGVDHQRLLAQLGDPPEWDGATSLRELLSPIYRAAARRAQEQLGES